MSKCEPVIADKITTETRLGQDCNGNPVYGGATFATCGDIPEVVIPQTCDGSPVTNDTRLATCEELQAVKDKTEQANSKAEQATNTADTALAKAEKALAENQSDIINITKGDNGRVIAHKRDGTTQDITVDTDQLQGATGDSDKITLTNEDGSKVYITKAVIEALIAGNYIDNTELQTELGNLNFDQVKGYVIENGYLVIKNEDNSKAKLSLTDLKNALNNGMATDTELANAINGIVHPRTVVKAGTNTTVSKNVSGGTTTYTVNASGVDEDAVKAIVCENQGGDKLLKGLGDEELGYLHTKQSECPIPHTFLNEGDYTRQVCADGCQGTESLGREGGLLYENNDYELVIYHGHIYKELR